MANDLKSLSDLFQNRLFRIPDYQRGYAWKRDHLENFWEDLINVHEDRYHYTGQLSLKAINRNEVKNWHGDEWLLDEYAPYHVVDGQQRLTTSLILINEILEFVKGLSDNQDKTEDDILLGDNYLKDIKSKEALNKSTFYAT